MTVTFNVRSLVWWATAVLLGAIGMWLVLSALQVEAAPGDDDTTFVPIANCRLFDFRPGPDNVGPKSTPLGAGDANVHTQQVTGTNGNCTVPGDAVAVSLNVTIAGPTDRSNLRVFPADIDTPLASNLNWVAGQAPTPNKVDVKLSADGKIKIFNERGTVFVLADVLGYYTSSSLQELAGQVATLQSDLAALQSQVTAQANLLAPVSQVTVGGQPTLRFTGVNVQIVDGSGDTPCSATGFEDCNGRGNLFVGYHEDTNNPEERTGSHNIVAGVENDYTSHSGIVTGLSNTVSAEYATVVGGSGNQATARYSTVTGGASNLAGGLNAVVSGGVGNQASGDASSVSGGIENTASGFLASVAGGEDNVASGRGATVAGGIRNAAGGESASVAGGDDNQATGDYGFVGGGFDNTASGPRAVVAGGGENVAGGSKAVVSGGSQRSAPSTFDWAAGTLFQNQ